MAHKTWSKRNKLEITPLKYILVFIFLLCIILAESKAQKLIPLEIEASRMKEKKIIDAALQKISVPEFCSDTSETSVNKILNETLIKLYDLGYIAATFDSVYKIATEVHALLSLNKKYTWITIRKGNVDDELISTAGFKEKYFRNKPVYFKDLIKYQLNLIRECENSGYPFATIKLDSIILTDSSISASLCLKKGNQYIIDSVLVTGSAEISDIYIRNYIGIKPHDVYNENLIKQITTRIKEISFVSESKPLDLEFFENSCKLILHLDKRKASQINGVIGFLPDDSKSGRLVITGDFQLKLNNPFGNGETMDLAWKSPGHQTQDLKTHLVYPFVVSRFGLDLGFAIYKKDTTYVDVTKEAGIQYLLPRGNYLKAFVNNKTTSLQSVKGLENATTLPPYADVNSLLYGLGIRSEKLDYRINPRKGVALEASAATGTRVISKHPKINPRLYDSLDLTSTQYNGQYNVDYFISLRNRTVLDLGMKGGHLIGTQIFANELFRLGGLRSLRGFDEESIYASSYDMVKVELRYLLEQNSFFALFWNGAYYENRSYSPVTDRYDTPYGFGAGVSFETKLGIFSVNYALGKQFNNPIEIRSGKIHFGLVNNF